MEIALGVVAVVAALLVIPEVRRMLGLHRTANRDIDARQRPRYTDELAHFDAAKAFGRFISDIGLLGKTIEEKLPQNRGPLPSS